MYRKIVTLIEFAVLIIFTFVSLVCGMNLGDKAKAENLIPARSWDDLSSQIKEQCRQFNGEVSIIIKDLHTGRVIDLDSNKLYPSASLVKLPVMIGCFYANNEKKICLENSLELKRRYRIKGSGKLLRVPNGTAFSIDELISFMIAESNNGATNMLIDCLGFDYLNYCFEKIGLRNTNISRHVLDSRSRSKGRENYTSAADMAFLLERIYNQKIINAYFSRKSLEILKKQKVNDRIPAHLPESIEVAHKTGLEKGVCHDVGIVFTPKGDFLICVLTHYQYNHARRAKKLISKISYLTYIYYQYRSDDGRKIS
ncbi:MAG: serine hydrolase [Elusimicrobia bacterium]|nr:serine hydrolase [Elusimicrobiota bacterium]